jgi:hypothetical protein
VKGELDADRERFRAALREAYEAGSSYSELGQLLGLFAAENRPTDRWLRSLTSRLSASRHHRGITAMRFRGTNRTKSPLY